MAFHYGIYQSQSREMATTEGSHLRKSTGSLLFIKTHKLDQNVELSTQGKVL